MEDEDIQFKVGALGCGSILAGLILVGIGSYLIEGIAEGNPDSAIALGGTVIGLIGIALIAIPIVFFFLYINAA